MAEEFELKNIDETRNYFIEEIEPNQLMSKKHKKVCVTLDYIEHFSILASTVTGCISISAFASLVGIFIGITSSVIALKIYTITATIRKYKSIINKNSKKHTKIVLVAKTKLNITEALNSQAITDSNICRDEFVLINNVLKEYDQMIEEIKYLSS